jgi:hypothetical protein
MRLSGQFAREEWMNKEVKQVTLELLRKLISAETCEIEENRRQINRLADTNATLKRLRAEHIQVLRDFEQA